jgi:hypothetical protein
MSEKELPNSSTPEGEALAGAMEDYEGMLGECKDYSENFLEYYAQNYPDQAEELRGLLEEDANSTNEFNMETEAALADLNAVLGEFKTLVAEKKHEAEEAAKKSAQEKAAREAKQDAEKKAERGRIVTEISNEIQDLDFGDGTTQTIELMPDGVTKVTITNPAVGPAGTLVLQSTAKYINEDTPWTIMDSGCDYDSGIGGSALAYAADDVYALETELKLIKTRKLDLSVENSPFRQVASGYLACDILKDYSPGGFGQIEADDPQKFVGFANARYKQMSDGPKASDAPQMSNLRREDDKELGPIHAVDREMSRIFDATMKNLNTWEGLYPESEDTTGPSRDFRKRLDDAYARYKSASSKLNTAEAQKGLELFKVIAAELEVSLPEDQREVVVTEPETSAPAHSEDSLDRPARTEAPDYAPPEAQQTFRARLEENQNAAPEEKTDKKPSADLVEKDGIKELTIHLPTTEDVRNSRITDFVGPDGSAIKLYEGALATTQLTLLKDDHGQAEGTVYTYQDGTWMSLAPDGGTSGSVRLKIYDGTPVAVGPKQSTEGAPAEGTLAAASAPDATADGAPAEGTKVPNVSVEEIAQQELKLKEQTHQLLDEVFRVDGNAEKLKLGVDKALNGKRLKSFGFKIDSENSALLTATLELSDAAGQVYQYKGEAKKSAGFDGGKKISFPFDAAPAYLKDKPDAQVMLELTPHRRQVLKGMLKNLAEGKTVA